AALGAEVVWERLSSLPGNRRPRLAMGCIAAMLVVSNVVLQSRMLYQIDSAAYERVVRWIDQQYPGRAVLVPDAMCEFHFLRMVHPELPVYLVNNSLRAQYLTPRNYAPTQAAWVAALAEWYGVRYVADLSALERLGEPPWLSVSLKVGDSDQQRFSWLRDDSRRHMKAVFSDGTSR